MHRLRFRCSGILKPAVHCRTAAGTADFLFRHWSGCVRQMRRNPGLRKPLPRLKKQRLFRLFRQTPRYPSICAREACHRPVRAFPRRSGNVPPYEAECCLRSVAGKGRRTATVILKRSEESVPLVARRNRPEAGNADPSALLSSAQEEGNTGLMRRTGTFCAPP